MTWWDDYKPVVLGLGIPGALSAAGRILWGRLVTIRDLEITELKAEKLKLEAKLEASNQRLLQTSNLLERTLGKYERERGHSSSRPPKST